ncbi:hypothetical protein B0H15DRAFT_945820 [Mycena belliarum]|uniref:Uncharacterized protein n=1 Tax=Mycena belliarum TaxID=1033014 RepID=A0AAD6UBD0_9AGAR|nr:hypothetical protein B0H15DRAFT_945820 [Mycena belliae]
MASERQEELLALLFLAAAALPSPWPQNLESFRAPKPTPLSGPHAALVHASSDDVLGQLFWRSGVFKAVSDTSQLCPPLLVKALINFAKARAPRPTACATGASGVIVLASICQHQFGFRSMTTRTGVLARTALTGALYTWAVGLSSRARASLPPPPEMRNPRAALPPYVPTSCSLADADRPSVSIRARGADHSTKATIARSESHLAALALDHRPTSTHVDSRTAASAPPIHSSAKPMCDGHRHRLTERQDQ